MFRRLGVIAFVAVLVVAAPAFAAKDSKPPRTVLKTRNVQQEGVRGDFCWGADGGQVGCTGPQDYDWPRAERARAGRRARIRIKRNDRPQRLSLSYYREVNDDGQPGDGRASTLDYKLVKREREKGAVWDVWFRLPEESGHFYLDMTGRWRDNDDGGEASYWFHLRLR